MTVYEVFRLWPEGGYAKVGEADTTTPKKALDEVEKGSGYVPEGEFLIVPKNYATYMRRRKVEEILTEEYDPYTDDEPQEVLT